MALKTSGRAFVGLTRCPGGTPNRETPDFTTMTGLMSARLRATRENLRGLPIDSRYSPTASVESSSIQYCMRSLPETSTRLPAETKVEMPRFRRAAEASTAMPRAPDWANRPSRPCGGSVGAREALSRTAGSLLMMPKELGPTTRIPDPRARRTSSAWSRAPVLALLCEPARDDEQREDSGLGALVDHVEHRVRRDGDEGEVHRPRHGAHRRVRRTASEGAHVRVDGVDRAGEAGVEKPVEELAADRLLATTGADERDGPRVEQGPNAQRLRAVLA